MNILNNFPQGYNTYNVGSGESNTLEEVVEIIATLLGRKITIDYDNEKRTGDIVEMIADNSKICKEFNWMPTINLRDGLELTLKQDLGESI
jgi:UDP-glucose 4-epimerase